MLPRLLLLFLLVLSGCIHVTRQSCVPFEWQSHPKLGPKAAMTVPVSINGKIYRFQSDTGSDTTFLYDVGLAGPDAKIKTDRGMKYVESSLQFAGKPLGNSRIYIMDGMTADGDTQGTLGTDVLAESTMIVDFQRRQFCVLDDPSLYKRESTEITAVLDKGKPIIPIDFLNPTLRLNLFLDTGSSALPVFTDKKPWDLLTKGPSKTIDLGVWGKSVPFIGAQSVSTASTADYPLNFEKIFYRGDRPELFKSWNREKIDGLIGLAPFFDREWIYITFSEKNPKFGIGPKALKP